MLCEICQKNNNIQYYFYHKKIKEEHENFYFPLGHQHITTKTYSGAKTSCVICDDCINKFRFKDIFFNLSIVILNIIWIIIMIRNFNKKESPLTIVIAIFSFIYFFSGFWLSTFGCFINLINFFYKFNKDDFGDGVAGRYKEKDSNGYKTREQFKLLEKYDQIKRRKTQEEQKNNNFVFRFGCRIGKYLRACVDAFKDFKYGWKYGKKK